MERGSQSGFLLEPSGGNAVAYRGNHMLSLDDVTYDQARQRKCLDRILGGYFHDAEQYNGNEEWEVPIVAFAKIWRLAAVCKNPAFSEEKEWRIVAIPFSAPDTTLDKAAARADFAVGISKMLFRPAAGDIVPYFTFPLSADSITDIRVGPRNRARDRVYRLRMFLRACF